MKLIRKLLEAVYLIGLEFLALCLESLAVLMGAMALNASGAIEERLAVASQQVIDLLAGAPVGFWGSYCRDAAVGLAQWPAWVPTALGLIGAGLLFSAGRRQLLKRAAQSSKELWNDLLLAWTTWVNAGKVRAAQRKAQRAVQRVQRVRQPQ